MSHFPSDDFKYWAKLGSDPIACAQNNTFRKVRQTHLLFPIYELTLLRLETTCLQSVCLCMCVCVCVCVSGGVCVCVCGCVYWGGFTRVATKKKTLMFSLYGSFFCCFSFLPPLFSAMWLHLCGVIARVL